MQRLRGLLGVMGSLGGFPSPGTEAASRESRQIRGLGILRGQFSPNFTPQALPGPSAEPSHPALRPQGLPALPASCAARRSHSRARISACSVLRVPAELAERVRAGQLGAGWGGVEEGAGSREGGPCRGRGRESAVRKVRSLPSSSPRFKGSGCVSIREETPLSRTK